MKDVPVHTAFWSVVIVLLLIMQWAIDARYLSPATFATPTEVACRLPGLLFNDGHINDLLITAKRTLCALIVGYPLGILWAVGIFALGRAQSSGELLLDVIRSTPLTALVPVFISIFGLGSATQVAIGVTAAMTSTAIAALVGIRGARKRFNVLLHLYRPSWGPKLFLVLLPGARSELIAALRLATSSALVLVVVSEMFIGAHSGIGKLINDKTYGDDRAGQFAAVICAAALGYVLNFAAAVGSKALHWGASDTKVQP